MMSVLLIYLLVDESRRLSAEAARGVPRAIPAAVGRTISSGPVIAGEAEARG
jgi:hypothetical protein